MVGAAVDGQLVATALSYLAVLVWSLVIMHGWAWSLGEPLLPNRLGRRPLRYLD